MKWDKAKEEKPGLAKTKRVKLDTFDLRIMWRTVINMYADKRIVPTLNNIRTTMQENIGYTGSKSILRKHMRKRWQQEKLDCLEALLERGNVVIGTIEYLRKISQL